MKKYSLMFVFLGLTLLSCNSQTSHTKQASLEVAVESENNKEIPFDSTFKTIHIFVALCDNKYQGIVPVPPKIGNGQELNNNLYWGCTYGIRTHFKNSKEWKLTRKERLDSIRLERLVFKHITKNYFLIADAYDGRYIEQCTKDFLYSSSGQLKDTLHVNDKIIGIAGNSKLLAYIGHDGLMDFELTESIPNADKKKRDVIILACYSKSYFSPHMDTNYINPLVWTSGLMCPEAYTIHDAISGYLNNETNERIRTRAALAYAKYQKCGEKAARNILITGW